MTPAFDWGPLGLSLQLATVTTLILLLIGVPLAWWLARTRVRWVAVPEAVVSLPLVLPPTVLGFYFLLLLSPNGTIGGWLNDVFDVRLVFSFPGLVIASVLYGLPFMVHPVQAGLRALPPSLREAAWLMGRGRWRTLLEVELPNIRPALLTGAVLTFAHAIGEFGVVLMIGGNLPGRTRVASIAIFDAVERMDYALAHRYALILLALSFGILVTVFTLNRRRP